MSFIKDLFLGGAEKKAAEAQAAGITEGVDVQQGQLAQTREDFARGIEAGDVSRERLLELLGLRGAEAEQEAISGFTESPGQKFLRERQERAVLRNAAATGGLGGGNVLEELQRRAFGRSATQLGERKDRLAGLAGAGLGAVGAQAGIGAGISSNIAELLRGRGEARATGILGRKAAIAGTLGKVAGAFTGTGGFGGGVPTSGFDSGALGLTKKFINPLTGT